MCPDADSSTSTSHEAGLLDVLADYQVDFKDSVEHWRSIETKAQASITMAGIFLAAGFALVRELDPSTTWWVRGLLLLGAVALMAAVAFAVLTLKVRTVAAPPPAGELQKLIDDFFRPQDDSTSQEGARNLQEETRNLLFDRIRLWQGSVQYAQEIIRSKAKQLLRAQLALLTALSVVAVLTGGAILFPGQFGSSVSDKGAINAVQAPRLPGNCD